MPLDQAAIARLIPHAGRMVLLDTVVAHDERCLWARSGSHRRPDHPLRRDQRLSPMAGVEYAAQAAAVHGALRSGEEAGPRPGFLAMLREVGWTVDRLDDLAADLEIRVQLLEAQSASVMYDFQVEADGTVLLAGRLAVFFPEPAAAP